MLGEPFSAVDHRWTCGGIDEATSENLDKQRVPGR